MSSPGSKEDGEVEILDEDTDDCGFCGMDFGKCMCWIEEDRRDEDDLQDCRVSTRPEDVSTYFAETCRVRI